MSAEKCHQKVNRIHDLLFMNQDVTRKLVYLLPSDMLSFAFLPEPWSDKELTHFRRNAKTSIANDLGTSVNKNDGFK